MPSSIFYSSITGKPLENPVVFDGLLCDKTEAEAILKINNPGLNRQNQIVRGGSERSLAEVKTALEKHGALIPARFLQPHLDAAYNESAWPRPSALRQNALIMGRDEQEHLSQTEIIKSAIESLFEKTVKSVKSDLSIELASTPKNKRYVEVLKKYGVIGTPTITSGQDPKITMPKMNLEALIKQAEAARRLMLDMRRVLMKKPEGFVMSDSIRLQEKLILKLSMLDKPMLDSKGAIEETASIQDAMNLLMTFSDVQAIATTRVYDKGNKDFAWHKLMAENEAHTSIEAYLEPFSKQYQKSLSHFTITDPINLTQNGELARLVLKELLALSQKQQDMGIKYTVSDDWSDELKAQRALVKGLKGLGATLEESLFNTKSSEEYRVERAKIYTDTLEAIWNISKERVGNKDAMFARGPRAGELAWHKMIADESQDVNFTGIYIRVFNKMNGDENTQPPSFTTGPIQNPFQAYETRHADAMKNLNVCALTGLPTEVPVIFLDGYVYDGNALHAYLSQGNKLSPVTGEDLSEKMHGWNLSNLSQILPVSGAVKNAAEQAQVSPTNEASSYVIPSAPPADYAGSNVVYPDLDGGSSSRGNQDNQAHAAQRIMLLEGQYSLQNGTLTIEPTPFPYDGLTGQYIYFKYDGKELLWSDFASKLEDTLKYLKTQGVIANYSLPGDKSNRFDVKIFGFNQKKLHEQANAARQLILNVKTATETNDLFNRRLNSSQRAGMNVIQDEGTLPDHVFYQRRNIVGESSRLSPQTRQNLSEDIADDNLGAAFECLACAREVVVFGAQGARNNNTSYIRPLTYLRTDETRQWYGIFESNIEKTYTDYGHYEIKRDLPYDFAGMAQKVDNWKGSNQSRKIQTLSNS